MSEKYKQYHIDNLKNSAMVHLPLRHLNLSGPGKNWAEISFYVLGLHDLRPRQGTFTNPWSATSNPIFSAPKLVANNEKLSNLLDRRANELLSRNQRIAVMWSGGIDSTCVLSSFIKNTQHMDQLVIYHTDRCIGENPVFYKNFIQDKIECRDTTTLDVTDEFIASHILTHGDPGDCIYGPSMPMYAFLLEDHKHLLSWRDNKNLIAQGIVNRGASTDFADWYTEKVSNNIEEVGVANINSISDWWWWHYFNLKWEFSLLRPFFDTRSTVKRLTIKPESIQKYSNDTFYNTDYIQCWSYTNLDTLCRDPLKHKIEPKSYIFDLDHNQDYFDNKQKLESITGDPSKRPAYMDQSFRSYFMNDPGVKEAIVSLLEQYRG
jgi:hypothetical protein